MTAVVLTHYGRPDCAALTRRLLINDQPLVDPARYKAQSIGLSRALGKQARHDPETYYPLTDGPEAAHQTSGCFHRHPIIPR